MRSSLRSPHAACHSASTSISISLCRACCSVWRMKSALASSDNAIVALVIVFPMVELSLRKPKFTSRITITALQTAFLSAGSGELFIHHALAHNPKCLCIKRFSTILVVSYWTWKSCSCFFFARAATISADVCARSKIAQPSRHLYEEVMSFKFAVVRNGR